MNTTGTRGGGTKFKRESESENESVKNIFLITNRAEHSPQTLVF